MNRRTFTATLTASLLTLPAVPVNAQRGRSESVIIVSETTGGEIDVSGTSFQLTNQVTNDFPEYTFEAIQLSGDHGELIIRIISGEGRYPFSEAYRINRSYLEDEVPDNFEEFGSEAVDGGGWMAFRLGPELNSYHEHQEDAFPDAHIWIELQVFRDEFRETLEEVQQIDLAGMPPFLFLEDSDADGDLFADSSGSSQTRRPSGMHGTGSS